jgi:mannose-6-phosphate isomerase
MTDPNLYPLFFEPVFRDYIWGGRNLETLLGRAIPDGVVAESWEISGHPSSSTCVENGPLAGLTLPQVQERLGEALVGTRSRWATDRGKFPLLIKLLDANRRLSVQVHPSDEYALAHEGGELGKAEMWYVLYAQEGAELIYGLSRHTDAAEFRTALEGGTLSDLLHRVSIRPGDVISVPTGTIHALLEGALVAEIQQNSDTTYRVYDWDRLGHDGKPRPLHVDKAVEVIDWEMVQPQVAVPAPLDAPPGAEGDVTREELCRSPYFVVEKLSLEESATYAGQCDGSTFEIWGSVSGSAEIGWADRRAPLDAVRFALLPAALGPFTVHAERPAALLRVYAPE